DRMALGLSRIEAHYFVNDIFLPNDGLVAGLDRIRHLPCTIVQGRYDIVCPIVTADLLARAWPEAAYRIIPDAGHSALEPGIRAALIAAADRALYAAKTRGGDQVMSGEDLEARPLRGRQRSAGQLPRGRDERHRDHEHAQRAGAQPSPVAATEGPADG
ncbi:MAG: hypothetical protein WD010_09660, partial [Nitriliruptor sp.]